jgi:putative nucleotidyltransferase with HDIG domain
MTPRGGELGDRYVRQRAGCRSGCSERLHHHRLSARLGAPHIQVMKPAQVFLIGVVAMAVACVAGLLSLHPMPNLDVRGWVGVLSFLSVGLLAECMAIDFGKGRQATSSLSFLPFLSSILLFSPPVALFVVCGVLLVSTTILVRRSPWHIVFNLAQAIIAVSAAAALYSQFLSPGQQVIPVRDSVSTFGFPFLAIVFFVTNVTLTSTAIAVLRGQPLGRTFAEVIGPRGGNLWYDLLASPIAIFPAALYGSLYIAAMAIVLLPLLLIRSSYLSKLQLEGANQDLLDVLVKAIETRDPYTSGHSMRVATLARLIAVDLGLPRKRVQEVERAALLHDIGKIDLIYASLLRKPYDLSRDERELIQTHAAKGAELLTSLSSVSKEVIHAVRHHHERYDGQGYPDGLAEEAIPLAARIIMLCDSIDAMLSDRPYRQALSVGQVRSELVRCSGSQFDPAIVEAILCRNTLERAVSLVERVATQPGPELVALAG